MTDHYARWTSHADLGRGAEPVIDYDGPERCVHCGAPIRTTNYALGPEVEHYDPRAGWASESRGTAWRYCRLSRATAPASAALDGPPEARDG